MVLVTTALEETFPKNKDEKILFLGEWCKLYAKKDIYEQYDYETLPYHWDDREKLYEDTKYIDDIYEKYLEILSDNLNKIHNVDFSISYWRIVLGPWLRYFIEMVYDRYLSIEEASKIDIDYVNIISINEKDIVPNNMKDFQKLYMTDVWNQFIYQEIINYFNIDTKNINNFTLNEYIKDDNLTIKSKIKNILFFLNYFNNIHFFSYYIKLKKLFLLQRTFNQVPTTGTTFAIIVDTHYSKELRDRLIFRERELLFEEILITLIKKQIPKQYLENYKEFRKKVLNNFPKNAEYIFTANAYSMDDAFKFWTAEKRECGTKYFISQHGGHYGMGLFSSHEKHQVKSSDKFLSWGWTVLGSNKVVPISAIKLDNKISSNPNGDILIPLSSFPRYSYHIMAMPIAGQTLGVIEDQVSYLRLASPKLKKLLKLRVYPNDYGWKFKDRFIDLGFKAQIDNPSNLKKIFHKRLSECRLCIATYNATTYLETFSANYPTLLYWNPLHWELNDEAKPYFKILEESGILHYSAESLVEKLEEIYENPIDWWNQDKIQKSKNIFCDKFANSSNRSLLDFIKNKTKESNV